MPPMSGFPSRISAAGWSRMRHAGADREYARGGWPAGPSPARPLGIWYLCCRKRIRHAARGHVMRRLMQLAASGLIRILPEDLPQDAPAVTRRAPLRHGPGPSRIAYRLSRIWMKTSVRRAAVALPLLLTGLIVLRMAGDPAVREAIATQYRGVIEALSSRPEFAVRGLQVTGASDMLKREIEDAVGLGPGASSLTLDINAVQARIAALGGVRNARVKLGPNGQLLVSVDERRPEALWRDGEGQLWLADRTGAPIGLTDARAMHPELPVIMGEGSQAAMEEALLLFRSAPEIRSRLRAFVRVGKRRWDVVLDRDFRIMLPEQGAEAALARIIALHYGEELLDRDLSVIDMRHGARPTLRLTPEATKVLRLRDAVSGPGKRT